MTKDNFKECLEDITKQKPTITLSDHELDSREAIMLTLNPNLEGLHFNDCYITHEAALVLGGFIKTNSNLKNLSANNCNLSNIGFAILARALEKNNTLEELHLHNCRITDDDTAIGLANSLMQSQSLRVFDIFDKEENDISNEIDPDEAFDKLEEVMKKNRLAYRELELESRSKPKRRPSSILQPNPILTTPNVVAQPNANLVTSEPEATTPLFPNLHSPRSIPKGAEAECIENKQYKQSQNRG